MGDFSRKTFNREKHYSGVLMQQGRVQLDADWNEQLDIQLYRTETEAVDVIGPSGVPKKNDGFKIDVAPGGHDLTIAPGRIYVDGLLCELDQGATYTNQPHFPNPDFTTLTSPPLSPPGAKQLKLDDGTYFVFLDAWQREIDALDDPLIREVALGGPDTATRLRTVYQIRLLPAPLTSPPGQITCETPVEFAPPATGKLKARTQPPKSDDDACLLPPTAGYNRLENQLYRVEIQKGGTLNQVTFKWSRDNGSVETTIKNIADNVVTVADLGKDEVLSFAGSQWVEIVDDESTLKGLPHPLAQIDKTGPGANEITLKTSVAAFAKLPAKLRRWDQSTDANADGVSASLASWIDLEGGIQVNFSNDTYRAGDYWLIPARTATGDIEWPRDDNQDPIEQLPFGIRHHFCRLALIKSQGGLITLLEDCRKRFPSLTEICAEDICFDNDKCDFGGAETVQDALDRLCAERDLRFHNKHLHGWGIVCGLQVNCGSDGTHVTVRPGYAIGCEGDDVIVKDEVQVDLVDLVGQTSASPPATLKDGELSLILDSREQGKRRFRVEPYSPPKTNLQSLLAGTLLADVFNDCLKSLVDFVKQEFTPAPGEEKVPVGPTQKRITTFSNLLIQLINKQNGSFVFLSGEKGQSGANFEDTILRNFYNKLREKLQSHTFCAMFDNARPFPEYPYSGLRIGTIFGKGLQKRLRVAPNGRSGYTVGANNKINVYDLEKGEMVDELEFPGGSGAVVQDVAFSKDGKQLYAVATLKDKDSFFAVADVSGFKHKFGKPTMICDAPLVTLATSPALSESVFAIGKGKGLYEINPQNVNPTPTPKYAFNAVGHLVIADQAGKAFASAATQTTLTNNYDAIRRLNLRKQELPAIFHVAARDAQGGIVFTAGEDDIALSIDGEKATLYAVSIVSSAKTNKQVVVFNALDPASSPDPRGFVDLGENTAIRLENNPATRHMMVTYEDSYRVGLIGPDNNLVAGFRHPVQISPLSIQMSPDRKRVYVLNYASNTISSIPAGLLHPKNQIPLQPLVDYRAGVLNAFTDLLGGLLQYLKDCFCDHFLVNCPTCDEDDKLYLACITIKNGKVFKVCNFSLRKYVHSFPTIEYWLSVVPIIPLIKKAVETFCCAVLPGFFSKFNAPLATDAAVIGQNRLTSSRIRETATFAQQSDFQAAKTQELLRLAPGRQLFTDFMTHNVSRVFIPQASGVAHTDVVGQPLDQARTKLEGGRVVIGAVEPYDPNKAGRDLVRFATAPTNLPEGTRVNLVTKDDKVLYYTIAEDVPLPVKDLRDEVDANRIVLEENRTKLATTLPQIDELRNRVATDSATVTETKAAIDGALPQLQKLSQAVDANRAALENTTPQIQELRAKVEAGSSLVADTKVAVDKALPQLAALQVTVAANKATLDNTSPQIADLRAKVDANSAAVGESSSKINQILGLADQVTSLRNELVKAQETHAQELSDRDKRFNEMQATFNKSLVELKARVDKFSPPH
jgi:Family of unknown function (DUF6519)